MKEQLRAYWMIRKGAQYLWSVGAIRPDWVGRNEARRYNSPYWAARECRIARKRSGLRLDDRTIVVVGVRVTRQWR
jgi:hypothetical protein